MPGKPNVLVIMSDEHDPAVSGPYGDPLCRTPHLDELAAGGVTFENCYTTSPLCVPARLSFTAGKYVSRIGAWSNSCRLPTADYPSIARIMTAAGYDSVLVGKQHYDKSRRYGFTDCCPQGGGNDTVKTGRGGRRDPESKTGNLGMWQERIAEFFVGDESESRIMSRDVMRTEAACRFLRERGEGGGDRPFFLFLGYISPHFPLVAPRRYHEMYRDKVPMPDLPDDWWDRLATNTRQQIIGFGVDTRDREIVKLGRELYWALTSWMDTEIGKVLATLRQTGLGDDTVVVYTSDHGENKGDHGMWWKNCVYEHAARIPLIVNYPERWAGSQRRTGACSLVDLVKTIAEVGGAEVPEDWDGDSLVPWLDDEAHEWKDLAVSEYYGHNVSSGLAMLRTGPWKYVYHTRMNDKHGPERELFNLEDDPGEWNNLAGDPDQASRMEGMHARLVAELGRDPEEAELECRALHAAGGYAPEPAQAAAG